MLRVSTQHLTPVNKALFRRHCVHVRLALIWNYFKGAPISKWLIHDKFNISNALKPEITICVLIQAKICIISQFLLQIGREKGNSPIIFGVLSSSRRWYCTTVLTRRAVKELFLFFLGFLEVSRWQRNVSHCSDGKWLRPTR